MTAYSRDDLYLQCEWWRYVSNKMEGEGAKNKKQGPNRSRTGDFGKAVFGRTAVLHSTTELPALGLV